MPLYRGGLPRCMGVACPVCEIPHQDATHLANHLAFTALTHGDDHEAWLDDAVPGWVDRGEEDLAAAVAELAPAADYDRVFEDTVGPRSGGHDHDRGAGRDAAPAGVDPETAAATGGRELDEAARATLEEARALTAEMLDGSAEDDDAEDDSDGG